MKQAKDLMPGNTQKAPPPAPIEYTESDKGLAQRLFAAMRINYGALFMSSLDNQKDQEAWERSWMASIHGKNPETVVKALKHCMDTQTRPFTRADFQQAYRSLQPREMYQRNAEAMALPKKPWAERREVGRKMLQRAKEIAGEVPKQETESKPMAYDREYFKRNRSRNEQCPDGQNMQKYIEKELILDYPNGEPGKLGWHPFED